MSILSPIKIIDKLIEHSQVFSQNDEDGAIEEVFRKIGTTDKVKRWLRSPKENFLCNLLSCLRDQGENVCKGLRWIWRRGWRGMQHTLSQVKVFAWSLCEYQMNIRESLGWDVKNSLLMDGGHERPEINLKKVIDDNFTWTWSFVSRTQSAITPPHCYVFNPNPIPRSLHRSYFAAHVCVWHCSNAAGDLLAW